MEKIGCVKCLVKRGFGKGVNKKSWKKKIKKCIIDDWVKYKQNSK